MRQLGVRGDMASRAKRMQSIRRKLADTTLNLDQMQDLGGCRAILGDIDGVNRLVERIRERTPHRIRREWDYIRNPKDDGYQSHHLSLEFMPNGRVGDQYAGRRIELQVRTRSSTHGRPPSRPSACTAARTSSTTRATGTGCGCSFWPGPSSRTLSAARYRKAFLTALNASGNSVT